MKKTIKLASINKDVVVKKQKMGKFIKALKILKNIPEHLSGLDEMSESKIISSLPDIIATSYDEIAEIIVISTELEKDEVEELYPDEFINLAAEIIIVNEFSKLFESVKKKFSTLTLK